MLLTFVLWIRNPTIATIVDSDLPNENSKCFTVAMGETPATGHRLTHSKQNLVLSSTLKDISYFHINLVDYYDSTQRVDWLLCVASCVYSGTWSASVHISRTSHKQYSLSASCSALWSAPLYRTSLVANRFFYTVTGRWSLWAWPTPLPRIITSS